MAPAASTPAAMRHDRGTRRVQRLLATWDPEDLQEVLRGPGDTHVAVLKNEHGDIYFQAGWPYDLPHGWNERTIIAADHDSSGAVFALTPTTVGQMKVDPLPLEPGTGPNSATDTEAAARTPSTRRSSAAPSARPKRPSPCTTSKPAPRQQRSPATCGEPSPPPRARSGCPGPQSSNGPAPTPSRPDIAIRRTLVRRTDTTPGIPRRR
jgi:hypothetical protein